MFTKDEILASIARNGLHQIGKNKWADALHEYSIVKLGSGFDIKCKRTAPWRGTNVEMRDALRPMFLAARASGRA